MKQKKISAKQLEILEYIKSQILEKGYPPTVRDICEAVNLKSTSSIIFPINIHVFISIFSLNIIA